MAEAYFRLRYWEWPIALLRQHPYIQENPGQTLQATALVHDAYIRLVDVEKVQHWDSRGHFFSAAAEAMRRSLIGNHVRAGSFLESPAVDLAVTIAPSHVCEAVGNRIGPYKLRELLGEGGMGSVFVAEQEKPVRRKVALKIIKPGMGSREVISRFETERQAIALMDHPNIARVLDAGTTDNGTVK